MRIIARPILRDLGVKHPPSVIPLNDWWQKMEKAKCESMNQLKKVFGPVDFIGDHRYVFNIGGNNYRLVALINFIRQTVYIRKVLTHAEYDILNKHGTLVKL